MMDQMSVAGSLEPRAKATLVLGGESFADSSESGTQSGQLASMREKSMVILKDCIIKHNVPKDVPDESIKGSSDDEGEALAKNPPKKFRKQRLCSTLRYHEISSIDLHDVVLSRCAMD